MAASGTIAELEGVLKITYMDGVNYQMAEDNMFLTKLEAYGMKRAVEGDTPKFNTQYTRSGGVGFRSTQTSVPNLPDASTGKHKQITVSIKELYGREEFNIRQVETAKGSGAFISTIMDKTDQLIRDFRDAYGISLYNNEKGFITTAAATPAVTQYTVTVVDKVRLQEGNVVDIYDVSGSAIIARKLTVASFDTQTNVVTFDLTNAKQADNLTALTTLVFTDGSSGDPAAAIAAGDGFIYVDSYNLSYSGLDMQILETGTIHDINRTNFPYYTSSIRDLGTPALLTNKDIRLLKNDIRLKSRKNALDCLLGNYDEVAGFEDSLDDNVRYNVMSGDKAPNLTGGFEVLRHDDLDVLACRYATEATLFAISTPSFMLYQIADTKFLDMGEGIFNRQYQTGQYEFAIYNYQELVSYNLRQNGAIINVKGLSE